VPVAETPPADAWSEWGGDGTRLVFSHANGFPPASYRTLLDRLTDDFSVATVASRPLWSDRDPAELASWDPLADDLVRLVERHAGRAAFGVGHSLGGTLTALAAARRPELFSALVLLDPVVFSGARSLIWGLTKRLGGGRRFPLVRGAARRRDHWPDRATARAGWQGRPVFASWDRRAFDDYLDAGLAAVADGSVALRYPKRWEARIFEICPHDVWPQLRRVASPTLVVRGESSDTLLPPAARLMAREMPQAELVVLGRTSHFLPMERPDDVARLIVDFAQELDTTT
jgi:pimeloyl-ACP methyl ester carboxylesterase